MLIKSSGKAPDWKIAVGVATESENTAESPVLNTVPEAVQDESEPLKPPLVKIDAAHNDSNDNASTKAAIGMHRTFEIRSGRYPNIQIQKGKLTLQF
ncbi:MAG: hypothetical protein JHC76_01450 [Akkermansiaceae bacterium]|nr:hypothetical protein [Akkermansiaceae bacterium]